MSESPNTGGDNSQNLLLLAQKRLSSLIGSLPVGIIIVSAEGRLEAVNPALLKLLNYDDNQLAGMPFNQLFKEAPWGGDASLDALANWFATQDKSAIELEIWDSFEELIPVDLSIHRFETGGKPRTLAVLVDVTDRYRAERLKNEFFSLIVHDIRAPISGVRSYLELLSSKPEYGQLTNIGLEKLNLSIENLDRIVGLVSELLDLDRLESRMVSLRIERQEITDIIEDARALVLQLADSKQIRLEVDAQSIDVECDRQRITQLICNLIANAIEHSPDGSEIRIKTMQRDEEFLIEVIDQGKGIAESEKLFVFERFKQGSSGTSRKQGFGLGLAIAKHIVRLHGGRIGVNQNENGGSTFWCTLPLSSASKPT